MSRTKRAIRVVFNPNRVKAVLNLQGRTLDTVSKRLPISARMLCFIVNGETAPTEEVLQLIRRELGEDGWRFSIGATDTLIDHPPPPPRPLAETSDPGRSS